MQVDLYSSSFCGACHRVRGLLDEAAVLVPALTVTDFDIASHPDRAEADDVRATPTTIVRDDAGVEVFRADGIPTMSQLLTALARAA